MTSPVLYNSSALPRIMTCPGSVELTAQAPRTDDSDSSEEGTAFHHFAALALRSTVFAVGDKAPSGFVCDAEMFDHANAYGDMMRADPSWQQRVEAPMHWGALGHLAPLAEQPWNVRVRCDVVTWRADISTLAVIDAKYGFRYVEVADNWQLLSQAIGACFTLGIQPERIILGIYQPRLSSEPRTITISAPELLDAFHRICDRLNVPSDALQTSPHCLYCRAQVGCPAAERAFYNAIDVAMSGSTFDARTQGYRSKLDLADRAGEFIKQHVKHIEGAALADMRNGKPVPGLCTVPQLGNTAWREGVTLQTLREAGNNYLNEVPVTPAEAVRRGMSQEKYDELTHRPTKGVKLLRKDAAELAAEAFGDNAKPKATRKPRAKKKD